MLRVFTGFLLIAIVFSLACSNSNPAEPDTQTTPAWPEFRDLIQLVDWENPELSVANLALAAGDTLGAADSLLAHFRSRTYMEPPHHTYPVSAADQLMEGRLILPPHPECQLPEDPTWLENPLNDSNWTFQYHSLRWSIALLDAWEETGDRAYLDRLLFLIADYAADCLSKPECPEMTWYDMSASLRTEHWLEIWRRLLLADEVDIEFMSGFLYWMWIHGDFLTNYVHYHWYNNHGTFHNRAAIVLPLMLPEFGDSDQWFDQAYGRLESQIMDMISPHGVQIEQAPAYHFFVMSLFPGIQEILTENDLALSPTTLSRIDGMPRFACHILKPNLCLPMISDSPISMSLAAYTGLSENLDFALSSGASGTRPTERFLSYLNTGYVICRSGWGELRNYDLESHAVFDAGPRGTWHGHNDALTFTFHAWGEDLIVDSGFFTYNEDEWREYFIGPAAHNVVLPGGISLDKRSDTPQRLQWRTGDDWAWQSALLDLSDDVSWIRHFIYLDPGEIILLDTFTGGSLEQCELVLHFHPDAQIQTDGNKILLTNGNASLEVFPLLAPELAFVSGGVDPLQGWYSPSYGNKVANTVAVYANTVSAPRFLTMMHAHDGSDPLVSFELEEDHGDGHMVFEIVRNSSVETLEIWTTSATLTRD